MELSFEIQACFCVLSAHTNIFKRDVAFWMSPLFEVCPKRDSTRAPVQC